jgi:hypothetical protein
VPCADFTYDELFRGINFSPEDEGNIFLRNVGVRPEEYTGQQPSRPKPQILHFGEIEGKFYVDPVY